MIINGKKFEVTYRAWDSHKREWSYYDWDDYEMWFPDDELKKKETYSTIGRNDKNGNKIYEGDILDYSFYKQIGKESKFGEVVEYRNQWTIRKIGDLNLENCWFWPDFESCEIVGNKCENNLIDYLLIEAK